MLANKLWFSLVIFAECLALGTAGCASGSGSGDATTGASPAGVDGPGATERLAGSGAPSPTTAGGAGGTSGASTPIGENPTLGTDPATTVPDAPAVSVDELPTGEGCADPAALAGTYAVTVDLPTTWAANQFVLAGGGSIRQTVLVALAHDGGQTLSATATVCNLALPPFQAGLPPFMVNNLNPQFQQTTFDAGGVPSFAFTTTVEGDRFTTDVTAFVLGTSFANAATDPWHATPAVNPADDQDGDGAPGVTATPAPGSDTYPADGSGFGPRAGKLYLAQRTVFSMQGNNLSCDEAVGVLTLAGPGIESDVVGCGDLSVGFGPAAAPNCDAVQTQFLDDNSPVYQSGGGTFEMRRIADGATCADVRAGS